MNTIGTILGSKRRRAEPRKGLICRRTRKGARGYGPEGAHGRMRARRRGVRKFRQSTGSGKSATAQSSGYMRGTNLSIQGGYSRRIREQGCGAAGCRRCADCCGVQSDDRQVCVASHLFPPNVPSAEPNTTSPTMVATAVRLRPGICMTAKPSTSGRELWSGVNDATHSYVPKP